MISFLANRSPIGGAMTAKIMAREAARAIPGLLAAAESTEQSLDGNCEGPDHNRLARLF